MREMAVVTTICAGAPIPPGWVAGFSYRDTSTCHVQAITNSVVLIQRVA